MALIFARKGLFRRNQMQANQAHKAARAMSSGRYGSFAAHIGDAYLVADPYNQETLLEAFTSLFDKVLRDISVEA